MFRSFNFANNFEQTTNKNLENCRNDNLDSYQKKTSGSFLILVSLEKSSDLHFLKSRFLKRGGDKGRKDRMGVLGNSPFAACLSWNL